MIIETTGKYPCKLTDKEKEKLKQASEVLLDIAKMMEEKRYEYLTWGYEDNPTSYHVKGLKDLSRTLTGIASAWEVEQ